MPLGQRPSRPTLSGSKNRVFPRGPIPEQISSDYTNAVSNPSSSAVQIPAASHEISNGKGASGIDLFQRAGNELQSLISWASLSIFITIVCLFLPYPASHNHITPISQTAPKHIRLISSWIEFPSGYTCTTRAEGWSGYSTRSPRVDWQCLYRGRRESVHLSRTKDRLSPGGRQRDRTLLPMRRDPRSGTPVGPLAFIPKT